MTDAQPTAVRLAAVTKRFEAVVAVDSVDLAIPNGEFFSLLGPSGCGKTTTLRMIAGLEYPTSGSITIFDEEMGLRPPNKRPVNTVFQSYALFPHMTVAGNVAFGLRMKRVPKATIRERVAEAIDLVRLGGMEERRPGQLSGGQQQRVALARALVNHPQVLLLDEPLGALDLKLRQAMQTELKDLQERVGITFVYVTHDQAEALTMSDRIGVMNEGKLLQVGSPEQIYEEPTTRFVADFIGDSNFVPGTVTSADEICLANGTRLAVSSDFAAGTEVYLAFRPERISLNAPGSVPAGSAIDGRVSRVTYLGSSVGYDVAFDWMTLHVRHENTPSASRFAEGDEVAVTWEVDGVAVVTA